MTETRTFVFSLLELNVMHCVTYIGVRVICVACHLQVMKIFL